MERIPSAPNKNGSVSTHKHSTIPHTNSVYQDNISSNGLDLFQKFDLDEDSYWKGLTDGLQRTLVGSNERNMPISYPNSDKSSEKLIDNLVKLFSDTEDYLNSLQSTVQNHIQNLKQEMITQNSENTGKIDQQLNEVERSLQSGLGKVRDMLESISSSVYDLNLVQQFQGEIINLTTRDCFRVVKDDFEARWLLERVVI